MKKLLLLILVAGLFTKCKTHNQQTADGNKQLASLLQTYFNDRMQLFPLEATVNGDNRFNNLLPIDFTDSYRSKLKDFFTKNQQDLKIINRDSLNDNDKISYDIFSYEMDITLAGLVQHYLVNNTFMPFDQFNGVPIMLGRRDSSCWHRAPPDPGAPPTRLQHLAASHCQGPVRCEQRPDTNPSACGRRAGRQLQSQKRFPSSRDSATQCAALCPCAPYRRNHQTRSSASVPPRATCTLHR